MTRNTARLLTGHRLKGLSGWEPFYLCSGSFNDPVMTWSPYLGMGIGMTRSITKNTRAPEFHIAKGDFSSTDEKMSIEEMILGYTINGAKQLGIEDRKGSIETGKDADFLMFDNDLLTAEHDGFSHNKPTDVYICGER